MKLYYYYYFYYLIYDLQQYDEFSRVEFLIALLICFSYYYYSDNLEDFRKVFSVLIILNKISDYADQKLFH